MQHIIVYKELGQRVCHSRAHSSVAFLLVLKLFFSLIFLQVNMLEIPVENFLGVCVNMIRHTHMLN